MAERIGNCLIRLIVGRDLSDKHKRWRLDRDNSRKLEAQTRNGTSSRPVTAHAAAVYNRSLRSLSGQSGRSPLTLGTNPELCGAVMPPGLGLALAPSPISGSGAETAMELALSPELELVPDSAGDPGPPSPLKPTSGPETPGGLPHRPSSSGAPHPVTSALSGPAYTSAQAGRVSTPAHSSSSNPSPKPQILMPNRHYSNVHSHYARVTIHVKQNEINNETEITDVMQSYDYGCFDTHYHIGFKCLKAKGNARMSARKAVDAERVPQDSKACDGRKDKHVGWVPNLIQHHPKPSNIPRHHQYPPLVETRRPLRPKSALRTATTGSMGR